MNTNERLHTQLVSHSTRLRQYQGRCSLKMASPARPQAGYCCEPEFRVREETGTAAAWIAGHGNPPARHRSSPGLSSDRPSAVQISNNSVTEALRWHGPYFYAVACVAPPFIVEKEERPVTDNRPTHSPAKNVSDQLWFLDSGAVVKEVIGHRGIVPVELVE